MFFLLDIRKHNKRSCGKRKNGDLKRMHKNKTFGTLAYLCKILKTGRHQMLLKLLHLVLLENRILAEEANKFYDRKHDFYQTALLTICYTKHALRPYIDSEMNHIRHFLKKFHSSIRVSISSIYLAYLETIQLNRMYLIILKIKKHLLFVINLINLLEVQYSISINWFLILISIQILQIHEIVKMQNSVINQQAILLREI